MTVYKIVENLSSHNTRGELIQYQQDYDGRLFSTYEKALANMPKQTLNVGTQYEIKGVIIE
jgi:hypothetical protein